MNKFSRRAALGVLAALAACASLPAMAQQDYPNRPIRLMVGYAAGGLGDVLARMVAERLGARLGQPVLVENRLGAGGTISAAYVAKAAPDGYTLMQGAAAEITYAVSTSGGKLPYDPVRDLTPITLLNISPLVLVVNPGTGFTTVKQLVDYGKANPGKLNYASFGNGSSSHFAAEMFKSAAGLDMVHVPLKGSAPAMQEVVAGRVELLFDTIANSGPQIRAGKLVPLAVTTAQRATTLPNVPSFKEIGMPAVELAPWAGMFAPAGTPAPIIARLNREVRELLLQPDLRDRLSAMSADPAPGTPEELGAHVKAEIARIAKVVSDAKLRFD
jgi:tripartite-type tricarboxylate transporter receptor subunit TctC